MLRILPDYGGQSRTVDGFVELAPELVAEIASSSASYDLHDKKRSVPPQRRQRVHRVASRRHAIDWFILRDGRYEQMQPDAGILRSEVFPGLWLMLCGDTRHVLKTLQQGVQSSEHEAFVETMANTKAGQ